MKFRVGIPVVLMLFASFPAVAMISSPSIVIKTQAVHDNSWRITTEFDQLREFHFNDGFTCQLATEEDLEALNKLFKFSEVRNTFFTTGRNWNDETIGKYLLRNV